ncbi:transcriptional regulator, LacI family [Maridesulfovibrio ferrireducens]|uniref:Transcriptional regulator, LacI family n=1 Tax=Maridesulfovibrio ferrireducens TaxID=246191 RepID=A0A1G9KRH6_9BACT|nr:LacI family DNA-binding transcriptional regulator [Maridesulfovibrio ferrireducens]SDL52269.1 transcriptional regulator, LacI family [Maridesulfovibrio ferrireducens]
MGQTTLKDLARKLGISASTVSRALHNHPDISDKTKRLALEAAEKYGYQPNPIAQSLKKKRSNIIGVIVPEIRHNFFATLISGIEEVTYDAGYIIMVCQSNETLSREIANTKALTANRVAGLLMAISLETTTYDHMKNVIKQGIPLVQFDRVVDELETGKVCIDDFSAAYKATSHLIDCGYKRIGFLAGREGISLNSLRFNGYLQALKNHGIPYYPELNINIGGCRGTNGRQGAEEYLKMDNPPDAILAINDPVAVGAFCRFREAGLRIPEDIALAGFSGSPESALIEPALTTISQPAFEMGRTAASLLLKELASAEGEYTPETIILETELLVRGSSCAGGTK